MSGTLDVVDSTWLPLAEEALATWIARGDTAVNRFLPNSELAVINESPLRSHQVSDAFIGFFDAARDAYDMTEGLCDPTVLDALEAWGYRDDFDVVKSQNHLEPSTALHVPGLPVVHLDRATNTLSTNGARLDFGSSAKAYVADAIAREVGQHTSVLVELGGDVALGGPRTRNAVGGRRCRRPRTPGNANWPECRWCRHVVDHGPLLVERADPSTPHHRSPHGSPSDWSLAHRFGGGRFMPHRQRLLNGLAALGRGRAVSRGPGRVGRSFCSS